MRVRWVKVWVDGLASLTERFRDCDGRVDFEALGREEYAFRHAIITGDFSRSERARDLYDATLSEISSRSEAGRKGAEARWNRNTAAATTSEGVDGNAARTTGCENYDQEAKSSTDKALDKAGAGEATPESVSAKTSPALPVLSFGEFENIKMTNMQYAKLCERFGCADTVIEEADQYFEAQPAKKKKYKNHYAMLLNWCKRRDTEQKPVQRYKNINDINQENYEKAMREIEAMCAGESV